MKHQEKLNEITQEIIDDLSLDYLEFSDKLDKENCCDIIYSILARYKVFELYRKQYITATDEKLIDDAIKRQIVTTNDILNDFKNFISNTNYIYTMDFDKHYQNSKTHEQNFQIFRNYINNRY